jgi:hypothetical protein
MNEPITKDALLPCPFCGAGQTLIEPRSYWTGMRSEIISVEVRHWCYETAGVGGSGVTMRAKTEVEAIEKWNRRTAL